MLAMLQGRRSLGFRHYWRAPGQTLQLRGLGCGILAEVIIIRP
jgi:hypothetical protein